LKRQGFKVTKCIILYDACQGFKMRLNYFGKHLKNWKGTKKGISKSLEFLHIGSVLYFTFGHKAKNYRPFKVGYPIHYKFF